MSMPAHRLVSAGDALARKRLDAYRRYAELVAEQEAALEAEDMDRFEALQAAAAELQAGLGLTASLAPDGRTDSEVASEAFVHRATQILRSTLDRSERIQARLKAMRREAGEDIRNLTKGRRNARTYMGSDADENRGPSLDLKL